MAFNIGSLFQNSSGGTSVFGQILGGAATNILSGAIGGNKQSGVPPIPQVYQPQPIQQPSNQQNRKSENKDDNLILYIGIGAAFFMLFMVIIVVLVKKNPS